jgi:cbb3-type cytochrome oxidase cytochrome c subunit
MLTWFLGQQQSKDMRGKPHSILPSFSWLVDQWLDEIFDMTRKLVVANRLAVVTETFVKERITEASYVPVNANRASEEDEFPPV